MPRDDRKERERKIWKWINDVPTCQGIYCNDERDSYFFRRIHFVIKIFINLKCIYLKNIYVLSKFSIKNTSITESIEVSRGHIVSLEKDLEVRLGGRKIFKPIIFIKILFLLKHLFLVLKIF